MLQDLRDLLVRQGRLSPTLIQNSAELAGLSTYAKRFGGLRNAYKQIGYGHPEHCGPTDNRCRTRAMRDRLIEQLLATHPNELSKVPKNSKFNPLLQLRGGSVVSVRVVACTRTRWVGNPRWRVRAAKDSNDLVTLVARLDVFSGSSN